MELMIAKKAFGKRYADLNEVERIQYSRIIQARHGMADHPLAKPYSNKDMKINSLSYQMFGKKYKDLNKYERSAYHKEVNK